MLYLILALLIALSTATFAFQNSGPVTIRLFKWEFQGSLAFIALSVFALGFLFNFFISIASLLRHRWTIYNQRKKIQELEEKLQSFSSMRP